MRYLRWIAILLLLLIVILELAYNLRTTSQSFVFSFWIPGRKPITYETEIWVALLISFALGFGLAIIFELYYWTKYKIALRKQNKVIEGLKKELESVKLKEAGAEGAKLSLSPEETEALKE